MLVYGTAIFLMEFISGDKSIARSRISFSLFFLGLTNLMFGWAHHTYFVPMAPWIRYLAYAVSMTEWVILARMIWFWKKNLNEGKKFNSLLSYRFLMAAEYWILFNLFLALLISIPAINLYTHGTHITVAHAMGSTIGINTMLLLASATFLAQSSRCILSERANRTIKIGLGVTNFFLFTFLISLTIAGITKGWFTIESDLSFNTIMEKIEIYLLGFVFSGIGLAVGLLMIIVPLLKHLLSGSSTGQETILQETAKESARHDYELVK
jgi:nitric oxide reductase subunit B